MTINLARYSRLIPGPVDVVFVIVLGMLLIAGRYALLNDPGNALAPAAGPRDPRHGSGAPLRHADLHARTRVVGRPVLGDLTSCWPWWSTRGVGRRRSAWRRSVWPRFMPRWPGT